MPGLECDLWDGTCILGEFRVNVVVSLFYVWQMDPIHLGLH